MNIRIILSTLLLSIFVTAFLYTEQSAAQNLMDFEGGRICSERTVDAVLAPDDDGLCPPNFTINKQGQCTAKQSTVSKFSFILNNDNSMDFGVNYWALNGSSCAIIGNAQEQDNSWVFEKNIDHEDEFERCRLTITMTDDFINLQTDPDAACRSICGIRASLDDVYLPLSELKQMSLTPSMLEQDVYGDLPCE